MRMNKGGGIIDLKDYRFKQQEMEDQTTKTINFSNYEVQSKED